MANDFEIDPKNKLGAAEWGEEDDSDFMDLVLALNGDTTAIARLRSLQGEDRCGGEVEIDSFGLAQLGADLKRYR